MSPPLSGSGAECSGRVHGGPSGTDRDGLGRRVHDPRRIGPRPQGLFDPIGSRLWRSGRIVRADAPEAPDSFRMIPRFPQNSRRVRGGTILPERHFRCPRPGSVTGPRPRRGGRRGRSDDPARSGARGNLKDDVSPFTTPIHPPLRPSSPYSEGPRSEAEQKRRSRRTARTGIGNAQRTRPWSRPRQHRPGRARRCPSPTPPGPRRPRPMRPGRRPRPMRPGPRWCEPGLGAGRARGDPEPSRTEPGLRNASPARRNPPSLAPCEPSATESACARSAPAHLAQCEPR